MTEPDKFLKRMSISIYCVRLLFNSQYESSFQKISLEYSYWLVQWIYINNGILLQYANALHTIKAAITYLIVKQLVSQ